MFIEILATRENANDDVIKVLYVHDGKKVNQGQVLFEVEGSKTVVEVTAEATGVFYPLVAVGQALAIGDILGVITDDESFDVEAYLIKRKSKIINSIDLSNQSIQIKKFPRPDLGERKSRRLAAVGAGRGLSQLFEILHASQSAWDFIGSYDDVLWSKHSLPIKGPILGPVDLDLIIQDFNDHLFDAVVITVSTSIQFRKNIYQELIQANIHMPNFIHPSCVVDSTADLGQGNMVMPLVHIGPYAQLGENNFISAYCNIEHHVNIGNHNTFGPSVVFSGGVHIGNENKFGAGIFIEPLVSIGDSCLLASGITLTKDIKDDSVVRNISNLHIKSRDE